MLTFLAGLLGGQNVHFPRRRSTNGAIGSQVESCEQRMYLTGGVLFGPAFDGIVVDPPVKDFDPEPPPAVVADYTGEWKHFFDRMTLVQTGEKVKGQLISVGITGAKVKGVVEGGELEAVIRGKGIHPTMGIGRFRITLNLTMDGANSLSGTSHTVFKGVDLGIHNVDYTRVL
ncbi:MAG: hypothetical protein KDA68_21120 [Planctomycetaceae bacterium]|nr:hypothetical protein [Planctomycetaceae bacterium]